MCSFRVRTERTSDIRKSVTSRDADAGKFLVREHNDGMRHYVYADNTVCL